MPKMKGGYDRRADDPGAAPVPCSIATRRRALRYLKKRDAWENREALFYAYVETCFRMFLKRCERAGYIVPKPASFTNASYGPVHRLAFNDLTSTARLFTDGDVELLNSVIGHLEAPDGESLLPETQLLAKKVQRLVSVLRCDDVVPLSEAGFAERSREPRSLLE